MRTVLFISLTLCIISFIIMFFYTLASNGIYHNYVGTNVFILENNIVRKLSAGDSCAFEWYIVKVDLCARFISTILITFGLIFLVARYKKQSERN
jgi:hypothetical protein